MEREALILIDVEADGEVVFASGDFMAFFEADSLSDIFDTDYSSLIPEPFSQKIVNEALKLVRIGTPVKAVFWQKGFKGGNKLVSAQFIPHFNNDKYSGHTIIYEPVNGRLIRWIHKRISNVSFFQSNAKLFFFLQRGLKAFYGILVLFFIFMVFNFG